MTTIVRMRNTNECPAFIEENIYIYTYTYIHDAVALEVEVYIHPWGFDTDRYARYTMGGGHVAG